MAMRISEQTQEEVVQDILTRLSEPRVRLATGVFEVKFEGDYYLAKLGGMGDKPGEMSGTISLYSFKGYVGLDDLAVEEQLEAEGWR